MSPSKSLGLGILLGALIGLALGYTVTFMVDVTRLGRQIGDLEGQVSALQGQIDGLQDQVGERNSHISSLQSQIEKKNTTISGLQSEISERDNEIANLENKTSELKEQVDALKGQIITLESQVSERSSVIADLQSQSEKKDSDIAGLESQLSELRAELNATSQELAQLQADYHDLFESAKQSTLENPTYEELKGFLEQDDTDENIYRLNEFDCTGFAIALRDHAWRLGFRCAYIEIGFTDGQGHALNAFQTVDEGLVFVDDVNRDTIAYLKKGQIYGTITLDGVKSQYISCDGDPAEFWRPLTYTTSTNLFSYEYYVEYQNRVEFYYETVDAYNIAVDEYNRGKGALSGSQLSSWYENLEALRVDLGSLYEPMGTVRSIEIYWD